MKKQKAFAPVHPVHGIQVSGIRPTEALARDHIGLTWYDGFSGAQREGWRVMPVIVSVARDSK